MGTLVQFPVRPRISRSARIREVFASWQDLEQHDHEDLVFSARCMAASATLVSTLSLLAWTL